MRFFWKQLPILSLVFWVWIPLGCSEDAETSQEQTLDLADNPEAYIDDVRYRRGILERDLREQTSSYAAERLSEYGKGETGWDALPLWDPATRELRQEDVDRFAAGLRPDWNPSEASTLQPETLPSTKEEWVALGRRVFFEYPLRNERVFSALVTQEDGLEKSGFLKEDDRWVGLRLFLDTEGNPTLGNTCAQCHGGRNPDGTITGSIANRGMNVGMAQLLVNEVTPESLPTEIDSTKKADLERLGAGRGDVQGDGIFNPFAFPDLGGIGDMPLLHHNATWDHSGVATMAVRCETLFITSNGKQTRIPRVLSWALAEFFHALPAPQPGPGDASSPEVARGAEVFDEAGCSGCHVPPLYSSNNPISAATIGTDPSATESPGRGTGFYRIPSLRGVFWAAPYLHHGAVSSLEEMLDPQRVETEPGHTFGHQLNPSDKSALLAFLKTL